jgi:hypothetical protein
MGTFSTFSGSVTATVPAKHFHLEDGRVIALAIPQLSAKITGHLAVFTLLTVIVIDGIAVITD